MIPIGSIKNNFLRRTALIAVTPLLLCIIVGLLVEKFFEILKGSAIEMVDVWKRAQ
jgi:hypothetical protein